MAAAKAPVIAQLGWSDIRPAAVVLVSGNEDFLADRAIRRLLEILRAEDPRLETGELLADAYAPGELSNVLSPSLFGEPRMIRVGNVEKSSDVFISEVLAYLQSPMPGSYLVLRHAGGVRGRKLLDAIRSGLGDGVEVVCTEIKKEGEKLDFAAAEFALRGRKVSGGALRALVTAFSEDLAELAAACQQLSTDVAEEITEAVVERYYAGRVETNAFRVADSAIAGRRGEALGLLRHAIASGTDPVPIVAAFASKLRTMAKVFGSRGGSGQLAARFGLAPWQVDRARRDLQGWTEPGLGRCIEVLAETDSLVKGGGRDPVYALERMIGVVSSGGAELERPALRP